MMMASPTHQYATNVIQNVKLAVFGPARLLVSSWNSFVYLSNAMPGF